MTTRPGTISAIGGQGEFDDLATSSTTDLDDVPWTRQPKELIEEVRVTRPILAVREREHPPKARELSVGPRLDLSSPSQATEQVELGIDSKCDARQVPDDIKWSSKMPRIEEGFVVVVYDRKDPESDECVARKRKVVHSAAPKRSKQPGRDDRGAYRQAIAQHLERAGRGAPSMTNPDSLVHQASVTAIVIAFVQ